MNPQSIRAVLVVGLAALLTGGCAATAARQTSLMGEAGVTVTTRELQVLTHELVTRCTGIIEVAATDIYGNSTDPIVRRRAAAWPTHAVPEFQWATLREDPLVGVVNGWIFAIQMSDFFETGEGSNYFGEHQSVALNACRLIEEQFEGTVEFARDPALMPATRRLVKQYAAAHPITNPLYARASPGSLVALQVTGSAGGLKAASEMNDQMRELSDRIGLYARTIPRQVKWQSTLLIDDVFVRFRVERDSIVGIVQQQTDAIMEEAFDQVGNERKAVLAAIAQERAILTDLIQQERETIFSALSAERIAALEQIQSITNQTVAGATSDVTALSNKAIDHAFARGLQLGGIGLAGVLALILVAWYFIRRDLMKHTA